MIDSIMSFITNINVLFYLAGYLVGSIPFGYLLVLLAHKTKITEHGSKSIGATNVYRILKEISPQSAKKFMIATIFLDSTKGLFVVFAALIVGLDYNAIWLVVIFVVIGHCYSIYLGFIGGKGVTTAIGTTLLLIPIEGIIGLIIWGTVGKIFKVSSLSSLFGVLFGILCTFFIPALFDLPLGINIEKQVGSHVPVVIIGLIVLWKHIPNIIRLIRKEEAKIIG